MATWDNNFGMWKASTGGMFMTQAEAVAAEQAGQPVATAGPANEEFAASFNTAAPVAAPARTAAEDAIILANRRDALSRTAATTGTTNATRTASGGAIYDPAAAQRAWQSGNVGGAAGAYNAGTDAARRHWDRTHETDRDTWGSVIDSTVNSAPVKAVRMVYDMPYLASQVGKAILPESFMKKVDPALGIVNSPIAGTLNAVGTPDAVTAMVDPLGYGRNVVAGNVGGLGPSGPVEWPEKIARSTDRVAAGFGIDEDVATQAPNNRDGTGGVGGAPGVDPNARDQNADYDTNEAEGDWRNEERENQADTENRFGELFNQINGLGGGDYALSDEARAFQREGLQQQRELLERMLGFDPEQYATMFADQTLARQIAAGRSGPGGYAAQQAGMTAAMDQAPALYAQGQQQAAALENQRLQAAAGVTKSFGELGTMTRGQDETRAQFEAELPVKIATLLNDATQGKAQLNEQQSARFAEIYMNFAQLQSVYAGMSSAEQMAWWDREMTDAGLKQQYDMFKQELAAQGKITPKDIIGGLFQLGGGAMTGGFSIAAAQAGRAAR